MPGKKRTSEKQTMVYVSRYAYRMQEPRDWTPVAHVVALDEGDARFFRPEQRTRYLIEKRNNQRAEVSAVYQVRKAEMSHSTARRWGLITEILGGDFSIEMANYDFVDSNASRKGKYERCELTRSR